MYPDNEVIHGSGLFPRHNLFSYIEMFPGKVDRLEVTVMVDWRKTTANERQDEIFFLTEITFSENKQHWV